MWLLLFMIMIMPFEKNPYLKISDNFLGVFPDFTVIKLVGLLGLAWAVFKMASGEVRLGILDSGQGRAFCLYLAFVVLASVVSGAGLRQATRMLAILCLLPIVLAAVRSQRDLNRALEAAAGILILIFPYAYRQMLRFGGARMGVGLYDPNYFALGLVLVAPLAFVTARQQEQTWKQRCWVAGFGVILVEVALTGSRGGLLGLMVVLTLLAFRVVRLRLPAMAGLGLLAGVFLIVPSPLRDRVMASGFDSSTQEHSVTGSAQTRIQQARAGLLMIRDHPLAGVGLGNFKSNAVAYGSDKNKIAHNTYVELAAEVGLPALAAFCYVLYSALFSLHRAQAVAALTGNLALRERALSLQIGLMGYVVSAAFLSAEYEKFLWLAVFLSICAERVARAEVRAEERLSNAEPAWTPA